MAVSTAAAPVDLDGVYVAYNGNTVLKDIVLRVVENEILSIVGPNGSGKSTLLRVIMGFIRPSRGTVSIFGHAPRSAYGKGLIGYLPQNPVYESRYPLRVFDIVAMSRYARKKIFEKLDTVDLDLIRESLGLVDMTDFESHPFGTLSGGQKQRVLIARALAVKPRILILDEPSTGLDAVAQDSFYGLLKKLRDENGLTILLVSHDIGSVSAIVDRIACLKQKIHFHGKPEDCIPTPIFETVFGKNVYFLKHDPDCETCRRGKC